MAQSSAVSCDRLDDSFGPHAGSCRGGFDFTLLFEETILTLAPLCIFLLVFPPRLWYLLRRTKKVVEGSKWPTIKTSTWISFSALQLVVLILWTSSSATRTHTSLATTAVSVVSTVALCVLSYVEHNRTVRPSSLLSIYLAATLLFDAAHARTLWLRAGDDINYAIAEVFTASVVVKALILALEAVKKRRLLRLEYQSYPPEATSGIYDRSFFWWLNSLIRLGFNRVLDVDDLFALDKHLQSSYLRKKFRSAWSLASSKSTNPYSLLRVSYGVLKWAVLKSIPPRILLTAFNFSQPFLINRAINLSQEAISDETTQIGYGLIGAYFLVYVGIAVSTGQYQHRTYRTITMVRGGLISIIYRKAGALCLKDLDPATSMTIMSADIERIVQGWQSMHEIWASIVEVGIAIYLLERQLGVACVVPVIVSIVSLLASLFAMNSIMSRQALWLEAIEKRISATSAMLASMKGVKMCGLKDTLLTSLQKLRVEELSISKKFRKLIIWNMVFAYLTQVFAPVLTFVIFAIVSRNNGSKSLDTAVAFTSLSLFALLSEPLAALVMSLATFLGATGSFTRIQKFLESEERVDTRQSDKLVEATDSAPEAVTIQDAAFGWDPAKRPLLSEITFSVPWQKLTMIVGPVGCGKSTLLLALLGEVPMLAGSVRIGSTSVGYCCQKPWHMNSTVRQAIVGNSDFNEKWYNRVVRACALLQDFNELPMGDSTQLGSGGAALSGGQGQRVALARAVYSRREILILDDTFSGLDASTESQVFHSLLGVKGLLREMRSTVVLVSSSAKRLPFSDHILCLGSKGEVVEQGTFDDLNDSGGYVSSFHLPHPDWSYSPSDGEEISLVDEKNVTAISTKETSTGISDLSSSETACTEEVGGEASRRIGDVQVYMYYVRSVGWWATILFIVAIAGFVFCVSFPNVWVEWWAADNQSHPNDKLGYWLGIYAMLGGVAIICLFLSCWQMIIKMVPQSGEKFHFALLNAVLSAPMSFLTNTDSGETMNRFSQDLQLIDMELPVAALNTFATLILCIAQMALIGVGSIYSAASFPIILGVLYLVQKIYLRTSRQLRLLDLETKAPLYSLFEESLCGLATIRAFGWQKKLEDKNQTLLDASQKPFYLLFAVQRWLTLILDLVVAVVAVVLVVLVVQLRGTVSAGGVGLALLNVIQFGQNIKLLLTFWTNLETHIGSVSRIRSFTETTASETQPGENNEPPADWPATGAIQFDNISATYNNAKLVLKNVSLDIKAGEKIGICGRTGSGKTSLITSLLRIVDLSYGTIRVDGVDISTLPREEVRRRIVCVPQQPFLLKGSVRLNVDPFGTGSDKAITEALQSVQLLHIVDENGGLGVDVDSLKLSGGQMQLLCLARAMIRSSTILILDEATSSIDGKTQEIIQRLIRKKFAGHTVISVAHRLETIMDFDKVAVMDAGRLVECDSPYALLEVYESAFGKLYSAALAEELEEEDDEEAASMGEDKAFVTQREHAS